MCVRLETNLLASLYAYVDAEYPRETEKMRERGGEKEEGEQALPIVLSIVVQQVRRHVTSRTIGAHDSSSIVARFERHRSAPVNERNETTVRLDEWLIIVLRSRCYEDEREGRGEGAPEAPAGRTRSAREVSRRTGSEITQRDDISKLQSAFQ